MTTELIAMLGGGASGFLFKLIGTMVTAQQNNVSNLIKKQEAMDASADAAAKRTGCLLYTSPSPRDGLLSRMPSSA